MSRFLDLVIFNSENVELSYGLESLIPEDIYHPALRMNLMDCMKTQF